MAFMKGKLRGFLHLTKGDFARNGVGILRKNEGKSLRETWAEFYALNGGEKRLRSSGREFARLRAKIHLSLYL